MSDVMLFGVLRMPYAMAMEGEISRRQFYGRAQEAADRLVRADDALRRLRDGLNDLGWCAEFGALAAEVLRDGAQGATVVASAEQARKCTLRICCRADAHATDCDTYDPARYPDEMAVAAPQGQAEPVAGDFVLAPRVPTIDMIIAGHESEPESPWSPIEEVDAYEAMSGCQRGHHRTKLAWAAMLAAAPAQPTQAAPMAGIVAWAEKDGDDWHVYDINSETGQHITEYQKESHYKDVFPIFDRAPAQPTQPLEGSDDLPAYARTHEGQKLYSLAYGRGRKKGREEASVQPTQAVERDAWISVSEQLPEQGADVWIAILLRSTNAPPRYSICTSTYWNGVWRAWDRDCNAYIAATHWMRYNRPSVPAIASITKEET